MITIALKRNIDELLRDVEVSIAEKGGHFSGDDKLGRFSGKTVLGDIHGNYTIVDGEIRIEITRKPRLVPSESGRYRTQ